MVWNSAGSTLYKAVERHNSAMEQPQFPQENGAQPLPKSGGGEPFTQSENAPQSACPCEEAEKSAPENRIHTPRQQGASPLQGIMQDRDTLLILAVLLLLLHEKADTKLIIALAFVIFC